MQLMGTPYGSHDWCSRASQQTALLWEWPSADSWLVQVPRLTEKQLEALRYFNALARSDELRMDMDLEPGDIQLLSNHSCLHSRSAFRDEGVSTLVFAMLLHASRGHSQRLCQNRSSWS